MTRLDITLDETARYLVAARDNETLVFDVVVAQRRSEESRARARKARRNAIIARCAFALAREKTPHHFSHRYFCTLDIELVSPDTVARDSEKLSHASNPFSSGEKPVARVLLQNARHLLMKKKKKRKKEGLARACFHSLRDRCDLRNQFNFAVMKLCTPVPPVL